MIKNNAEIQSRKETANSQDKKSQGDYEKRESYYTVGENVNQFSHYEKQ